MKFQCDSKKKYSLVLYDWNLFNYWRNRMLTIQPNFTRNTAFKGEKNLVDQETYEQKKKYYQDKQR